MDGIPSNDYIWVNYQVTSSSLNYNLRKVFSGWSSEASKVLLIKEELPSENCIILDNNMNEITSDSNEYYVKSNTDGELPEWSFYIGYPLSEFDGETITNTAKFYGQYRDADYDDYYHDSYSNSYTHEIEYIAEDTIEVNLNDFKFDYPPGNYGLIKHVYSSTYTGYKQYYSELLSFQKIKFIIYEKVFIIIIHVGLCNMYFRPT